MVQVKALRVPPSSGCVPLESSSTSPPSADWLGKTARRVGEAITTVDWDIWPIQSTDNAAAAASWLALLPAASGGV
jgi:hypothetical protein